MKTLHLVITLVLLVLIIDNSASAQIGKPFDMKIESPSMQFQSGVKAQYVMCQPNYRTLVIKIEDNSPACVKPETAPILVERGWGIWVGTSIQQTIPLLSNSMKIKNSNFTIDYDIMGNGKVLDANMDLQSKSLILSLETTTNGTLTVSIPRALLDVTKNNRGMGGFYMISDGKETTFTQIRALTTDRTFSIPFTNGTHEIEIIATQLI